MPTLDELRTNPDMIALLGPKRMDWMIAHCLEIVFALKTDNPYIKNILSTLKAIQNQVILCTCEPPEYITKIGAGDYPNVIAENGRFVKIEGETTIRAPHPDVAKNTEEMEKLLDTFKYKCTFSSKTIGYEVQFGNEAPQEEIAKVNNLMNRQADASARSFAVVRRKTLSGAYFRLVDENFYDENRALHLLKGQCHSSLYWIVYGDHHHNDIVMQIDIAVYGESRNDERKDLDAALMDTNFVSVLSWFVKVRTEIIRNLLHPLIRV